MDEDRARAMRKVHAVVSKKMRELGLDHRKGHDVIHNLAFMLFEKLSLREDDEDALTAQELDTLTRYAERDLVFIQLARETCDAQDQNSSRVAGSGGGADESEKK